MHLEITGASAVYAKLGTEGKKNVTPLVGITSLCSIYMLVSLHAHLLGYTHQNMEQTKGVGFQSQGYTNMSQAADFCLLGNCD